MLRKMLALTVAVGATAGIVSLGSALYADSAVVGPTTFTSGTVVISTDSDGTALFTAGNMAPGDVYYKALTVTNGGSLDLRYDLTSIATDPEDKNLAGQLQLTIAGDDGLGTCDAGGFATHGTAAYATGVLGNVDGVSAISLDTDRVLAAAGTEVLCFKIELPSTTGDAFQGATTVATFTLAAEQTLNN